MLNWLLLLRRRRLREGEAATAQFLMIYQTNDFGPGIIKIGRTDDQGIRKP
jgi:hypothetical protein